MPGSELVGCEETLWKLYTPEDVIGGPGGAGGPGGPTAEAILLVEFKLS
jgi:hypothetical protein